VHEYKTSGPLYRRTVQTTLKASYTNHYRRGLIRLLDILQFGNQPNDCLAGEPLPERGASARFPSNRSGTSAPGGLANCDQHEPCQRLMPAAREYRIVPAQPVLRSTASAAGLVTVR
jgi:hypothetical protein